ncbi:MAG: hypothetical protein ABIP89_22300 [Polyangiaceae bacterium]
MRLEPRCAFLLLALASSPLGCGGQTIDPEDAAGSDAGGEPTDASSHDGSSGFDSAIFFDDAGEVMLGASGDCVPVCAPTDYCFAIVRVGGRIPPSHRDPADAAPQGCYPFPSACAPTPTCGCVLANMGNPGPQCRQQGQTVCSDDAGAMHVVCTEYLP